MWRHPDHQSPAPPLSFRTLSSQCRHPCRPGNREPQPREQGAHIAGSRANHPGPNPKTRTASRSRPLLTRGRIARGFGVAPIGPCHGDMCARFSRIKWSRLVEAMRLQHRTVRHGWHSPPIGRCQPGAESQAEEKQAHCQLESIPSIACRLSGDQGTDRRHDGAGLDTGIPSSEHPRHIPQWSIRGNRPQQ